MMGITNRAPLEALSCFPGGAAFSLMDDGYRPSGLISIGAASAWIVQDDELLSRCLCLGQHLELGGSKSSLTQHNSS